MRASRGFTLIELVAVMVILSIVAAVGSGFVVTAVSSYKDTQERAKLVQKGRMAIEQMTRQLRIALPNGLRVSSSGNCVEFMPIAGGANYLTPVPSVQNGAAASDTISTAEFSIGLGTGRHAVVGALSADEVYTNASPASRAATAANLVGGGHTTVQLNTPHVFMRNSINQRVYITDDPVRFCVTGGDLVRYSGYGLDTTSPIADSAPGGVTPILMAADTTAPGGGAFQLSGGSEDRGTAVLIDLTFQQGDNSVNLSHQVLVRNVP